MLRVTKVHHSTLIVQAGDTHILIDPGAFGTPPALDRITAILITHAHADHLAPQIVTAAVALGIPVWMPADAASLFDPSPALHIARPGQHFSIRSIPVVTGGGQHALLHPDVPSIENIAYVLDNALFVTGDAHPDAPAPYTAIATPINAPWLRLQDLVRYIRKLHPGRVIGVHDGLLNADGLTVAHNGTSSLAPGDTGEILLPADGDTLEVESATSR